MNQHTATCKDRLTGGTLIGVVTSGALAAALMSSAPAANATCASFFSIGNSADCSSNLTSVAIAVGTGATATANGLFGVAFAMGDGANATIPAEFLSLNLFNTAIAMGDTSPLGLRTQSAARGIFSFAVSKGDGAYADARGVLGLAVVDGLHGHASTSGFANTAINLGDHVDYNWAEAFGTGNLAVNLSGDGRVVAGFDTNSVASIAFNTGGTNTVKTSGGPFAVAGAVDQNGATVSQTGPGINIQNGGSSATAATRASRSEVTTPTDPVLRSTKKTPTAAAVADLRHTIKKALRVVKRAAHTPALKLRPRVRPGPSPQR